MLEKENFKQGEQNMELKGSKTWKNLEAAYAGEAQARVKYEYYASQAKKDGYEQIADFFEKTSANEKEHAKLWFKLLHNGMPQTETNLKDGIAGEHYETSSMYVEFAKVAREEGFNDIAVLFDGVGKIEATHEARYRALVNNLDDDQVFVREESQVWECRNCGHLHYGVKAPIQCSVCAHPQAYFEIHAENY